MKAEQTAYIQYRIDINFELNQDVECQKYTINGNKACSMIFRQTPDYISDVKIAFMDVATITYHPQKLKPTGVCDDIAS